jgi:hypothetical protein
MKEKVTSFVKRFSNGILWGISIFIAFGFGMQVNPVKTEKIIVEKEVPIEKIVEKEVLVQCDYTNWKKLVEIDDEGFGLAATGMNLCSEGFTAASELDTATLTSVNNKMRANNIKITDMATRRQSLLKLLGY